MGRALHDNNRVPTVICLSSADGVTPIAVTADAAAHYINVSDGTTGSDLSGDNAGRDVNRITTWLAVSEIDGITPVPIYADASGNLLVDSTP